MNQIQNMQGPSNNVVSIIDKKDKDSGGYILNDHSLSLTISFYPIYNNWLLADDLLTPIADHLRELSKSYATCGIKMLVYQAGVGHKNTK